MEIPVKIQRIVRAQRADAGTTQMKDFNPLQFRDPKAVDRHVATHGMDLRAPGVAIAIGAYERDPANDRGVAKDQCPNPDRHACGITATSSSSRTQLASTY
jgi:hypothetical protein